jgi:hypothetical protein
MVLRLSEKIIELKPDVNGQFGVGHMTLRDVEQPDC